MKTAAKMCFALAFVLVPLLALGQAGDSYRKFNEYRDAARAGRPIPVKT